MNRWPVFTIGVLSLAATLFATAGGGTVGAGGIRVSITDPSRPFLVVLACVLFLAWRDPLWVAWLSATVERRLRGVPTWIWLAALSALLFVVGIAWGSTVAAASDAYGYITEAEMLRGGDLRRVESPIASWATWSNARATLAPIGWRPAEPGALVPVYPPGYPLLMAAAGLIHPFATFLVVPLSAVVTIWAVLGLARHVGVPRLGWAAAALLASCPAFLWALVVPMSDMPVTAAWTMATYLAMRPGALSSVGAGVAGGLGILIRPNLAPVGVAVVVLAAFASASATMSGRAFHAARVAAGVVAGALGTAGIFHAYYGSPLVSGYGDVSGLFGLSYVLGSIAAFAGWIAETEPWPVLVAGAIGTIGTVAGRSSIPRALLFMPIAIAACYLFYRPFDNWTYVRFLLPAFPVAMLVTVSGLHLATGMVPRLQPYLFAGITIWCAVHTFHEARVRHVFANAASVERYREVPRLATGLLPSRTVVIAREFSGSLHYYAEFETLRWDLVEPGELAGVSRQLHEAGFAVYAVLEARTEEPEFRSRFSEDAEALGLEPVWRYEGTEEQVTIYRVVTQ